MKTLTETADTMKLSESPLFIRTAIHEFSENESHENWLKLSRMLQFRNEGHQSVRAELLKGIVAHILSNK